jgi:hypothetical protein
VTDEFVVKHLTEADCPKVSKHIGWFEVSVRRTGTHFVGWAIQKTEEEARTKALSRLEYVKDCEAFTERYRQKMV